ncbi:unnamed protein product [Lactuca virosa]|uniref:Uncharacterized protein n=1 Tax=Lactuca virosa TaxID=75947 RepID=A0AAU9N0S2_9ASTR|nr:unnamed protein product [Lactuca virosa]
MGLFDSTLVTPFTASNTYIPLILCIYFLQFRSPPPFSPVVIFSHKSFDSKLEKGVHNRYSPSCGSVNCPTIANCDAPQNHRHRGFQPPPSGEDFHIQYKEKHPNNNFVPIPNKPFVFIGPAIRNRFSFPALSPTLSITKNEL